MTVAAIVVGLASLGLVIGCDQRASSPATQIDDARARWSDRGFDRYVVDVTHYGDRPGSTRGPFRITVDKGTVVAVTYAPGGPAGELPTDLPDLTVEALFDRVDSVVRRTSNLEVDYDAETGMPTQAMFGAEAGLGGFAVELVSPVRGAKAAGAKECAGLPGSPTDLMQGPPRARADRDIWTTPDGCIVRSDVVLSFDGAAHCGWQSASFVVLGRPPGSVFADHTTAAWYVRDPNGVLSELTGIARFEASATLPSDARDTGLRRGETEVWIEPGSESALFIRNGARVERWPRAKQSVLCA